MTPSTAVTEPDRDHDHGSGAGLGGEDAGPFLRLHLRVQEVVDGQAPCGAPQLLGQLADVGSELVRDVAEGCQGADVPLRAAQHAVLLVDGVGHDPVHAQALAEHRAEHVEGALDVGRPAQRPLHVQGQLVHHQALRLLEVEALVVLQQPVEVRGQVTDLGDLLVLPRPQVPLPRFWRVTTACRPCSGPVSARVIRRPTKAASSIATRAVSSTTTVSRFRLSTVAVRPASRSLLQPLPDRGVGRAEGVEQRLAAVEPGRGLPGR